MNENGECLAQHPMTFGEAAYGAWFHAKVNEAMNSAKSSSPHSDVMSRVRESINE